MKPIYLMGKCVGCLREDRTFICKRKARDHMFYRYEGFALSYAVISQLRRQMCRRIVFLVEREDGTRENHETTPDRMLEWGERYAYKGGDNQVILPLSMFDQKDLGRFL